VLDAERSLYESQDAVVQSERAARLDLVSLYKALGGGWDGFQIDGST
jgi:multidrug efflux system outer membrane protein